MEIINAQERIDTVLNYIKVNDIVYKDELINKMGDLSIMRVELGRIVEKLILDGYITVNESNRPNKMPFYVATFDGFLFYGYVKKAQLDNETLTSISRTEIALKKYNTRLFWATLSAGIAAAFLLLWQIWIWFYPFHKDFVHRNDVQKTSPKKP